MKYDQVNEASRLVEQVRELENARVALCKFDNLDLSLALRLPGTAPGLIVAYVTVSVNDMSAFVHAQRERVLARLLEMGVEP